VSKVEDLQRIAPALTVTNSGLTQNVNIRGIGLASGNANASNGVATYIDGMFQPPVVTTTSAASKYSAALRAPSSDRTPPAARYSSTARARSSARLRAMPS
jgi:hypothetical protein